MGNQLERPACNNDIKKLPLTAIKKLLLAPIKWSGLEALKQPGLSRHHGGRIEGSTWNSADDTALSYWEV